MKHPAVATDNMGAKKDEKADQLDRCGIRSDLYRLHPDGTRVSTFIKTGTDFNMLPSHP